MGSVSNRDRGGNTFAIFQLIVSSTGADIQKSCGMVGLEILIVGFIAHILNAAQHDVCIDRFQRMVDFCEEIRVTDTFRLLNHYGDFILLYLIASKAKLKQDNAERTPQRMTKQNVISFFMFHVS